MIKNKNIEKTLGGKTIRLYVDSGKRIVAFRDKSDRDQYLKVNPKSKIIGRTNAEKKFGACNVSIARVGAMGASSI